MGPLNSIAAKWCAPLPAFPPTGVPEDCNDSLLLQRVSDEKYLEGVPSSNEVAEGGATAAAAVLWITATGRGNSVHTSSNNDQTVWGICFNTANYSDVLMPAWATG